MFKPIKGFEAEYSISHSGDVWSIRRKMFLKPYSNGSHFQVDLRKNGKRRPSHVHILVLEHFGEPRPDGMWGLHKDDDSSNNHIKNLYWGTAKGNAIDRKKNRRCVHCGRRPW